ncbi:hypothetical protein NXS19_003856 [Fusarium pseudograminearum]|nr:hypothetical protein NXS19_003856 [Fusarium pseudograminearum]
MHYGAGVYSLAIRDSIPTVDSGYIVSILYSPTVSFSHGTNIIDQVLITAAAEIRVYHLSDHNIPFNHLKFVLPLCS